MKERAARLALGVVSGLVLLAAAVVDLPAASDGRFWSDAATYHAMAGSLAFDADLEFAAEDLARVRRSYPAGPQGVFLKRVSDARGDSRLVYAKAALYPAVAAPFVRVLGADRGLLMLNALVFVAALWLGYGELRRRDDPGSAAAGALGLLVLGVAPVYLFWQTPEVLNLGLATAGLVALRRGRIVLAAVLFGLAAYSKPTHLALALPLLLAPLLDADSGWGRRVLETARRAAVVALSNHADVVLRPRGLAEDGFVIARNGEGKLVVDAHGDLRWRAPGGAEREASVEDLADGWRIAQGPQRPATIEAAGDHRIAIAFGIAALAGVAASVELDDPDVVAVSDPTFWAVLGEVSIIQRSMSRLVMMPMSLPSGSSTGRQEMSCCSMSRPALSAQASDAVVIRRRVMT